LGKFGKIWAKILCTPKNLIAPTPMRDGLGCSCPDMKNIIFQIEVLLMEQSRDISAGDHNYGYLHRQVIKIYDPTAVFG